MKTTDDYIGLVVEGYSPESVVGEIITEYLSRSGQIEKETKEMQRRREDAAIRAAMTPTFRPLRRPKFLKFSTR